MSFPVRHSSWQSVSRSDESDIPETDSCISNTCVQLHTTGSTLCNQINTCSKLCQRFSKHPFHLSHKTAIVQSHADCLRYIHSCCLRPGLPWNMSAGAGHNMSFPVRHIPWQSVPRSDESDIPEAVSCISYSHEQSPETCYIYSSAIQQNEKTDRTDGYPGSMPPAKVCIFISSNALFFIIRNCSEPGKIS